MTTNRGFYQPERRCADGLGVTHHTLWFISAPLPLPTTCLPPPYTRLPGVAVSPYTKTALLTPHLHLTGHTRYTSLRAGRQMSRLVALLAQNWFAYSAAYLPLCLRCLATTSLFFPLHYYATNNRQQEEGGRAGGRTAGRRKKKKKKKNVCTAKPLSLWRHTCYTHSCSAGACADLSRALPLPASACHLSRQRSST